MMFDLHTPNTFTPDISIPGQPDGTYYDAPPVFRYKVPIASKAQEYKFGVTALRESCENEIEFRLHPEWMKLMVDFATEHIISVENLVAGGEKMSWDDDVLLSQNLTKGTVVQSLGTNSDERKNNLMSLVGQMMVGIPDVEKKSSDDYSSSNTDTTKTDAPVLSAPGPTTETTS